MTGCWEFFGDVVHATKGCSVLGEGISKPKIYKGWNAQPGNMIWEPTASGNPYQVEHDLLFDAIRNDKPWNETERCAKSCFTAIMGRMACESGKLVTLEEAMNSNLELAPGLDSMTMSSPAPVMPDEDNQYQVAQPGKSVVL
jgi:hypothetical protein